MSNQLSGHRLHLRPANNYEGGGMRDTTVEAQIKARMWERDAEEGVDADVEFERTATDEVVLYTFVGGEGSVVSVHFSREGAIAAACELLNAASLR